MADITALKNRIRAAIKANDNQEITGPMLQQALLDMVDELDLNPELENEAQQRQNGDTQLNNLITGIKNNIDNGYVYAGIATPSTVPVSGKVFYIATAAGTYTNFGNQALTQGINILRYNGSVWSNQQLIGIDDEPTAGSNNLVKSGGVRKELDSKFFTFINQGTSVRKALDGILELYIKLPDSYIGDSIYLQRIDRNYGTTGSVLVFWDATKSQHIYNVQAVDEDKNIVSFTSNNVKVYAVVDWGKFPNNAQIGYNVALSDAVYDIRNSPYIMAHLDDVSNQVVSQKGIRKGFSSVNVYDASVANATNYATLADAIAVVPDYCQNRGLILKFKNSTSNKEEIYRLEASTWSTNIADWKQLIKDIDAFPTNRSKGLANSGGIRRTIDTLLINSNFSNLNNPEEVQPDDNTKKLISDTGIISESGFGGFLYTITNSNDKNKTLYVSHDFKNKNEITKDLYNVALYNEDSVCIKGGIFSGSCVFAIPSNYTLKLCVFDRMGDTAPVYKSFSLKDTNVELNQNTEDISLLKEDISLLKEDLCIYTQPIVATEYAGHFVKKYDGSVVKNNAWHYKEFNVTPDMDLVEIIYSINGGADVAAIAAYDNNNVYTLLKAGEQGNDYAEYDLRIQVKNYAKIRVCTNANRTIALNSLTSHSKYNDILAGDIKVQTWGDSITAAGRYQSGIAEILETDIGNIKNAGLGSDFSMHVRRRFVSYFTDETPYKGTATYSVPSLAKRQEELQKSFFVFWIGTNNLLCYSGRAAEFTTGSSAYMALQPNPDFRYDKMYARSYIDMILQDIKQMVDLLPHTNFAIIGGHGGFSSASSQARALMLEMDEMLARMYPRNFIDVRELVCMDYNYQNTYVETDFIKPALNGQVTINISDTSWVGNNRNDSNNICIGTKYLYDKYHVDNKIDSTHVLATLIESNTEFVEGDTIRSEYLLVSDLGRDSVNMKTRVYSYEDCLYFSLMSYPRSSSDPIHFTADQYIAIGRLIGKEIIKMIK